jgi:hypothetical protein
MGEKLKAFSVDLDQDKEPILTTFIQHFSGYPNQRAQTKEIKKASKLGKKRTNPYSLCKT